MPTTQRSRKPRTYIVNDFGLLYRMTEPEFRRYLALGARSDELNPAFFGRRIGQVDFTATEQVGAYEAAIQSLDGETK